MIQIDSKSNNNDLARVLHYYGLLEGEDNFKIVCPFHNDINASLQISLSDNFFYCHGCAKSGNGLKFVLYLHPKMDQLEACMLYYKVIRSRKVKQLKLEDRTPTVKADNKQALIEAHDYYYGLKTTNWTKEAHIERAYMRNRGFFTKTLNECKAKVTFNNSYPIIFPIYDLGRFRGWVCRTTDSNIEKKRKYLYNEGFSRRNTIAGDYDSKIVTLVEGYMDKLRMNQNGLAKVGAILGWKVTEQQITKLKEQGVETIISALDNDECGNKGTKYLKQFFKVVRFQFPEGVKDPGEMTKKQFKKAMIKTRLLLRRMQNG